MPCQYFAVQTHGGRCCGIKTIWNFPYTPITAMRAKEKMRAISPGIDIYGRGVRKDFNWCRESRPLEIASERLLSIIDYIKKRRPQGLIEVVLSECQQLDWSKTLLDIGFRSVSTFENSNSGGNKITVYHLSYDYN